MTRQDLQQDPKFSKFYNFEATSRDEAKAEVSQMRSGNTTITL